MAQGPIITGGYYLVAFIDVLGQRNLLREMHDLPEKNNKKQMAEFVALFKKTVGTVTGMRNLFLNYFKGSSLEHFILSEFNPEQQKILQQAKSNPLKSHMFSDFVILFLPLRDDVNKVPVSGVYSVLGAIASTFLAMLAIGHAIRGSIDVGVGMELSDDEIYGAALARAYQFGDKNCAVSTSRIRRYAYYISAVETINNQRRLFFQKLTKRWQTYVLTL